MASHRYASRQQAEIEARDYSQEHHCTVSTYKLVDGRYENVTGESGPDRAGSLMAQYHDGRQLV